jgi:hypothetical protein
VPVELLFFPPGTRLARRPIGSTTVWMALDFDQNRHGLLDGRHPFVHFPQNARRLGNLRDVLAYPGKGIGVPGDLLQLTSHVLQQGRVPRNLRKQAERLVQVSRQG